MAKQKVVKETNNKFQDAIDKLNKTYGVGSILALDSKPGGETYDVISTGSITLFNVPLRLFDNIYSFDLANTAFGALLIIGLILGAFKTFQQRGDSE